ncbi:MAG: DUF4010 domain-containing protein [Candidatus Nanoarchaeia archaeon]|nr:DUF4010 domain-containing protein [Candidatus Nanoarchaeia archaeon]MDD5239393.1 DUF4010 domain-containing protein [Candidatus Nanoarchaeia archaeon]
MVLVEFVSGLIFSILVGALVGIEREHVRATEHFKGLPIFGVRTVILFSILGFFFTFLAMYINAMYLVAIGALTALVVTTIVYFSNVLIKKYTGSTTYIAMMAVFFLGAFVGLGGYTNYLIAAIGSIVITGFLAGRNKLRSISKRIEQGEIFGAIKFGIIAFIILPLLPNRTIDPLGIFNPFQIWYVVVIVSAIYFVSYVLMRLFSEKGLLITSMLGGLVSGSMITFQLANWLKRNKKLLPAAATGVMLTIIAGLIGDLFVIAFVFQKFDLLLKLLPALSIAIVFLLAVIFVLYKDHKRIPNLKLNVRSPFALKPALEFGAFYLALLGIGTVLGNLLGALGLYPLTVLASLVSSSTSIISTVSLYSLGKITLGTASQLVLVAIVVAFLTKMFWASYSKNIAFMRRVAFATIAGSAIICAIYALQAFLF